MWVLSCSLSPVNSSMTHCSCAAAMRANSVRPAGVSLTVHERRSAGSSSRTTRPSFCSSSVSPVTLPPLTISRFDSSLIFSPPAPRSSCASKSKRANVMPNSARRRTRISASIRLVQASSRSQTLSAWWSSSQTRASRSTAASELTSALRPRSRCSARLPLPSRAGTARAPHWQPPRDESGVAVGCAR